MMVINAPVVDYFDYDGDEIPYTPCGTIWYVSVDEDGDFWPNW